MGPTLAARFRARLLRRPRELEGRRPLLALPAPPRRHRPVPAEEAPLCPRCRTRHHPRPHPAAGEGMAALYSRMLLPDPGRPTPLNRQADELPLELLRRHRSWHQP
jgi:hypothetical protein